VGKPSGNFWEFCGGNQNFGRFMVSQGVAIFHPFSQGVAIGLGYVRLAAC